jgi:hypothetical protein
MGNVRRQTLGTSLALPYQHTPAVKAPLTGLLWQDARRTYGAVIKWRGEESRGDLIRVYL